MTAATDPSDGSAASDALLRPVRPLNAFEDTVERLLQTIRLGVLQPGESLPPERELAARLGVSRDTVREAIKSLSDAGRRRGPVRARRHRRRAEAAGDPRGGCGADGGEPDAHRDRA